MIEKIFYGFIFLITFFAFNSAVSAATISDGVYEIKSAIADKMVDVADGKTKNKTNVQLYTSNSTASQKWQVKEVGNDYYEITTLLDTDKALDVDDAGKKSGTNVQIYKKNGTNAQKWRLKYAGDGYYYIISKCNDLYLDVDGASSKNGTNIQMYKGNKTKAQKFKFIEVLEGTKTIEDGLYKISSMLDEGKTINIKNSSTKNSTATELRDMSDNWSNIWRIKYLNNGYYSIISYLDETKVLDVDNANSANFTKVQIYQSNNSKAQKWIIKDLGDGSYSIVSGVDHKYIDINNGEAKNGNKVQIYQGNSSKAQKFKFTKVEEQVLTDGYYTLNSALDETKVVSVNSEIAQNGVNVNLKTDANLNSQKWYIKYLGDGYYSLTSGLSDVMVMDVDNNGKTDGTNVWLYQNNDSVAQKWYIKAAGDGYYYLIAKNSGLYLDVANDNAADGTNIQIYTSDESKAQKFKLNSTTKNENDVITQNYEEGYYTIISKLDENKAIDIVNGEKANGTNVWLYQNNNTVAQIWHLNKLENGYYSVTSSMNPEIALTVDKDNVEIAKYTGADTQKWAIKDLGNGYAYFVSKANGLNLNIAGGKNANGTNVEVAESSAKDSQMFKLVKNTSKKVYTGIDVSHHQDLINWASVSNSDVGFVIIRAGYGGDWTYQDDRQFLNNVAACEKYNIPYGLYLYSYASEIDNSETSAQAEAKHMLRLLDEIEKNNYSPNLGTKVFIDMEDESVINAGKDKLTSVSDTFCSTIEGNGYSCGIYANKTWLMKHLNTPELAKKYEIWLAEWINNNTMTSFSEAKKSTPSYNLTPYKYWQFTSKGKMSGISGNIDMNIGYDIFG